MNKSEPVQACDPYALIEVLMHSSKAIELRLDAALAPVGISATKWKALRHLTEAGGQLTLGQLAERLSCVKSNATQLVDRLATEQLVRRVPDPLDRRIILAELTPAGQQRYTEGLVVVKAFEREFFGAFQEEERILLHRLLERLSGFTPAAAA
ncbi:MAG: MarR family transcriptional regulator [Caldilineaceae bacterium]|nr:MarR family transcriptional regulator [Caldilineaceae bacterium]